MNKMLPAFVQHIENSILLPLIDTDESISIKKNIIKSYQKLNLFINTPYVNSIYITSSIFNHYYNNLLDPFIEFSYLNINKFIKHYNKNKIIPVTDNNILYMYDLSRIRDYLDVINLIKYIYYIDVQNTNLVELINLYTILSKSDINDTIITKKQQNIKIFFNLFKKQFYSNKSYYHYDDLIYYINNNMPLKYIDIFTLEHFINDYYLMYIKLYLTDNIKLLPNFKLQLNKMSPLYYEFTTQEL
jgi:hypothetical protein